MLNWIAGWWLAIDGVISLIIHLPDKRQNWTQDHGIRIIRTVIGVWLIVANIGDLRRLKRE